MSDLRIPDFSSIVAEETELPYSDSPVTIFKYSDPILNGYQVFIAADSQPRKGSRLSTLVCKFPRCILSEINTHRVFSRNSASSRARSIKSTIQSIYDEPYIPLATVNRKGMSGDFIELSKWPDVERTWLEARDQQAQAVLKLLLGPLYDNSKTVDELVGLYYSDVYGIETADAPSLHKQNVNRLLEPFMFHEAVISSTEWDNFFYLRCNLETAAPEIVAIARLMEFALDQSTSVDHSLHLPFIPESLYPESLTDFESLKDLFMVSSTEAAQVSYKDKAHVTKSTASVSLGERLLREKHLSPFEHSAVHSSALNELKIPGSAEDYRSNFASDWVQLRKLFEG